MSTFPPMPRPQPSIISEIILSEVDDAPSSHLDDKAPNWVASRIDVENVLIFWARTHDQPPTETELVDLLLDENLTHYPGPQKNVKILPENTARLRRFLREIGFSANHYFWEVLKAYVHPNDKTCADCCHYVPRCSWLISFTGQERRCDWSPSHFELLKEKAS